MEEEIGSSIQGEKLKKEGKIGFLDGLIKRANGEKVSDPESSDDDVSSVDDQSTQRKDDSKNARGDGRKDNSGNTRGDGRAVDQSGLNPNRIRGFGSMGTNIGPRVETPSFNDMRAKQGAIVAKFMTFLKEEAPFLLRCTRLVSTETSRNGTK